MPEARLEVQALTLRTRRMFGISRGARQSFENLLVRVLWNGVEGLGEIAPSPYYGERAELARASVQLFWEATSPLVGEIVSAEDPTALLLELHRSWDSVVRRNGAARCGLDMALWDLWGKVQGKSVSGLWGPGALNSPGTSYTIGIDAPETLDERLEAASGFRILKVKLGGPDDLGTLAAIRERDGRAVRVDANCAWRGSEAVQKLGMLRGLGIEMIEQPCPPRDLAGLRMVREAMGVPVYADESAETLEDIGAVAGFADGVNIKLAKCGGPTPAMQYIRRARQLGLEVMLGCMIESSLGITAAAHLAPGADRLDLDGALLLDRDPFLGVEWADGRPRLPQGPGLGVTPRA